MDEERRATAGRQQRLGAWLLPLVAMVTAVLILTPGLGASGLWTLGELPILDRTLAALGEPRAELLRSPWLPDQLRTWAYAASGRSDLGLRLPGALAGVGLVGLTIFSARRLGFSPLWASLAGCFALALPLVLASSRTVLGNPTGELWLSAAVVALVAAGDRQDPRSPRQPHLLERVGLAVLGLACLGAAIASMGVVIGGCLPLMLVALADVAREDGPETIALPRALVVGAWTAAALAGGLGLWLAWHQGEGYIPLLGAARDLELLEDPTKREFTATLEAVGYQLFPLTGLVALGMLGPRRTRWPALWLGVALILVSLWSLSYGATAVPVTVPAALLGTGACQRLFDTDEPITARRLILFFAILGALVLGKDAGRTPGLLASPLLELGPLEFPAAGAVSSFDVHESLPRMAKRFAALLLLAHMLAPPSRDQLRLRERLPKPWWLRRWSTLATIFDRLLTQVGERDSGLLRARAHAPLVVLAVALLVQAWTYGRTTLTEVNRQMSIAAPLQRFARAVEHGEIPDPTLSMHRIRDPGLDYYGPGAEHEVYLGNRGDLDVWLSADEPRTALIRRSDLPAVFVAARSGERPLFVLDDQHHAYVLVANFLPEGHEDQNPLLGIVYDEPMTLANETLLSWDPYVDLIAWEIEGEIHRGSTATLHLVFRVHRPLPTGTKLYARLQKGKASRVAAEPHELTGGALPPNYWRAGDFVHHRHEFEVPWLEVLPGEHELIVGLRRSEKTNLKITTPEGKQGEHGVLVRGKSHEFAVIGTVELAW